MKKSIAVFMGMLLTSGVALGSSLSFESEFSISNQSPYAIRNVRVNNVNFDVEDGAEGQPAGTKKTYYIKPSAEFEAGLHSVLYDTNEIFFELVFPKEDGKEKVATCTITYHHLPSDTPGGINYWISDSWRFPTAE